MATTPIQLGNKWDGNLVNRPTLENKGASEKKTLAPGTKETPTDLAPGLRPRPHPAVPMMHGDFKGMPPPPPPPGGAPILKVEREAFKLPPRTPKNPNAPAKLPAKLKITPQVAMLDELKDCLGKKALKKCFEEPKREPPRKSPTLMDEVKAEIPGKIAKLKPIGNAGNVGRMKEDIEKAKAREDEHKRASPAILGPPKEPMKPKEPIKPKGPAKWKKPTIQSPKRVDSDKVELTSRPPGRPEAVAKIELATEPQTTVETRPVTAETSLEEPPDPYILWPIQAFGISLILLGLLKVEIYLWVISWNAQIWNQLYV
ncbi:uncharacterized protein DFL_001691 [Arthrobotrys flagrans]|uniref:Uncharacterized protein n=1 Tax=Arthrobotrys flagrans TaxID=97331 RepID=A0A437A8K8_ARTFL|nr:hypothetical protein DFL_001691 [Arthrobotrys flagrans]